MTVSDADDPRWDDAPARWVRERLNQVDVDVRHHRRLRQPYAADRRRGVIWLPEGDLDVITRHLRIGRCLTYIVGGSAWAPELGADDDLDERVLEPRRSIVDLGSRRARWRLV